MSPKGGQAPDEAPPPADLEADRAESADGLPLPAPDDAEPRVARNAGGPKDSADKGDADQRELDGTIAAERGAD